MNRGYPRVCRVISFPHQNADKAACHAALEMRFSLTCTALTMKAIKEIVLDVARALLILPLHIFCAL